MKGHLLLPKQASGSTRQPLMPVATSGRRAGDDHKCIEGWRPGSKANPPCPPPPRPWILPPMLTHPPGQRNHPGMPQCSSFLAQETSRLQLLIEPPILQLGPSLGCPGPSPSTDFLTPAASLSPSEGLPGCPECQAWPCCGGGKGRYSHSVSSFPDRWHLSSCESRA